ncbi:hypothetical protein ERICIV_03600 [Paenibacillus larvae subsp. larvae]|uniref:DUF6877 domain-containing protein n=1 Tax=Paenibacillus larvae subsp. larvae TaxID=147375 RepID=A0A2L1UHT1_9BACL|nr:DUF6877 family protein [Paenibacillus larvae]AQT84301.1 hypothetical protein B1222_07650 [Paenibacillus larvae subsp. pulvifaciens]AQZ46050.1 hypothetical protein B5S25_04930 [Paenibacillus larvae subsp. pulvifaciens]AQZ46283.1 hypothetical protein B5S25_06235 [Paenibacillus larvae subsp. pulvifaciens]AVF27697.1 hypothetical protein ERICIII_03587 [Paenibacillus larvae subsp. larvae]AVF27962.1 hypothetical protein ERICIII_03858 [Paenibacillus larvae subsp. larvae]
MNNGCKSNDGVQDPLREILKISGKLPPVVLRDIDQRIGDWLAMGGRTTDSYIVQQLRYAKRFLDQGDEHGIKTGRTTSD